MSFYATKRVVNITMYLTMYPLDITILKGGRDSDIVFNATFNNISVISMEETGLFRENH